MFFGCVMLFGDKSLSLGGLFLNNDYINRLGIR